MIDYKQFLIEGKNDEDAAIKIIESKLGGKCYLTSQEVDMKCHTDIIWESPKGITCAIDKKMQKKVSRTDSETSDEYTWIEYQNVQGYPGSGTPMVKELRQYGFNVDYPYDYLMIETNDNFLFVQRYKLINFYEPKVDFFNPVNYNPQKPYIAYQREGRKDLIFLMPIKDLEEISQFKLKKQID